jgi:hypothetical protein
MRASSLAILGVLACTTPSAPGTPGYTTCVRGAYAQEPPTTPVAQVVSDGMRLCGGTPQTVLQVLNIDAGSD